MNDKIKSRILDRFISISAKVGHCIDERWIVQKLKPSLNPKEQEEVEPTIDEMKNEDLISVGQRAGITVLVLNQTGFDAIYQVDPVTAKAKIQDALLGRFSSSASKVGHCIDERWILHTLTPSLNPKEQEYINSTLADMESDGLVTLQQKNSMLTIALTKKGYDKIY